MKSYIVALSAIALAACSSNPRQHAIYMFKDGKVGYQDDNQQWYYFNGGASPFWAQGVAPTSQALSEADVEEEIAAPSSASTSLTPIVPADEEPEEATPSSSVSSDEEE